MTGRRTQSNAAPQNPSIFIKATPEFRERVQRAARAERRSVSNFIHNVIERHLDAWESACGVSTSGPSLQSPDSLVQGSPVSDPSTGNGTAPILG